MRRFAAIAFQVWITASPSHAQECSADDVTPLWHQAACDLAVDSALLSETIEKINERLSGYDESARNFMVLMSAGLATTIDLNASPQAWVFETTSVMSRGETTGVLGPYLPRTAGEDAAEGALIDALATEHPPTLRDVLIFAQLLVENRGGKLLVGLGPPGMVFPMAVSVEDHCRWANVSFTEFALLGTVEAMGEDGLVPDFNWNEVPAEC